MGALGGYSVKRPTLDLRLGLDFRVMSSTIGLHAGRDAYLKQRCFVDEFYTLRINVHKEKEN